MTPGFFTRGMLAILATVAGTLALTPTAAAEEVRVCVVAILATDRNQEVDPRLECIAREVRKQRPQLTGFRLARINCKPLLVGTPETFPLVESKTAEVTVEKAADRDNRVRLMVKAPQVGQIIYTSACGKYFPIVTGYQTNDKDRLIIAVMIKPCHEK